MFKMAAIIGGVLLLAGVALAGTVTSLGSTDSPTIDRLPLVPAAATTGRQHDRGREREARRRAGEPREDLRGPCDEPEHANDARCAAVGRTIAESRGPDRGHDAADDHGGRSGRGGGGGEPGHGGDD